MLSSALDWYQERIGLYDKQSWEATVEQRIHRGLLNLPKKNAKLKTDFIDLDLIRGSTFPKAKPPSDFWLCGFKGILRLIFVPFHWKWWIRETTLIGFSLLLATCFSVGLCCAIYWKNSDVLKEVSDHEVFMPIGLLILLGVMHSHMTCTRSGYRYSVCRKNVWDKNTSKFSRKLRSNRSHKNKEIFNKEMLFPLDQSIKMSGERSLSEDLRLLRRFSLPPKARLLSRSKSLSCLSEFTDTKKYRPAKRPEFFLNLPSCKVVTSTDCGNTSGDLASSSDGNCQSIFKKISQRNSSNELLSPVYLHTNTSNSHVRYRRRNKPVRSYSKSYAWNYDQNTDDYDCSSPRDADSRDGSDEDDIPSQPSKVYSFLRKTSLKRNYLGRYSAKSKAKTISDWIGTSSNGDEVSCSSGSEPGFDFHDIENLDDTFDWQIQGAPATCIPAKSLQPTDKVSCKIWEGKEVKKVNLSVLDISSIVISRVDKTKERSFYLFFGITMAIINAAMPSLHRYLIMEHCTSANSTQPTYHPLVFALLGNTYWSSSVIILSAINRFLIGGCFLFLLSVTERAFRLRLLHAKYFCYLTSARRARKYDAPHFRLNKVVNIKAWLSIRSCLKKCGPQHSVDVIVSVTFVITSLLVSYLCFEALKDEDVPMPPLRNCEFFIWCVSVSIYLIRFMTLAANINKKYSSPSILVMEQINMYLHLEQKPEKKEDLMLANNVLKLVTVLLKELDSPFKISGISANPVLYNVTKVVMLSACSAVLSDILGFKLKLHRIKFK